MAKEYLTGKVMVAFKPEADQAEVEKVLGQYRFEKVFNKGEFDNATDRVDQVLARLYQLSVTAGTEEDEVKKLKALDSLVEMAFRPAPRVLR